MNESPLDIAVTVARSAEVVGVAVTAASLGNDRCHWLLRWNDSRRGRRGARQEVSRPREDLCGSD